jgi:hypothetical protein
VPFSLRVRGLKKHGLIFDFFEFSLRAHRLEGIVPGDFDGKSKEINRRGTGSNH